MEPVCHSCDKKLGKRNDLTVVVPPEAMSMAFSAELAAKDLGVELELIDTTRMTLRQKMDERLNGRPVPRLSIREKFVTGNPSKDEIIALYHSVCHDLSR
jgi:hypothetical protein